MEQLKHMKETLASCVQNQISGHLSEVNAAELGAAVDMIKDLSEAIYYCTITEAMEEQEEKEEHGNGNGHRYNSNMRYYSPRMMEYPYPIEYYDPRYRERYNNPIMYANGSGNSGSSSSGNSGGSSSGGRGGNRNYHDDMYPMYPSYTTMEQQYPHMMERDPREGKSAMRRKMYMEGKAAHKDKAKQMQELESYMQELSSDLTEMIQDASPEEKQLLQQKISVLATKIK